MATWRWVGKVSKTPICPPSLTVLNIGQFLDEDTEEKGWDQQQWLLAYAHALQHMGEAADGRNWRPNRVRFTPQVSQLVNAFIDGTQVELVEAEVILCWNEPQQEAPHQRDEGIFVEVISCLDQLAKYLPTRWAWDELVFPPPPTKPCLPHQSGHLGYIRGSMVDLGQALPSLCFASVNWTESSFAWHKAYCSRGACWPMTPPLMGLSGSPCGSLPVTYHWWRRPLHES